MTVESPDTTETDPDLSVDVIHVADDEAFVETAAANLERESDRLAVRTFTDAAAVLASLAGDTDRATPPVDCIVSGYRMPGMDGLELLAAVRERYPDLPFILYTDEGSEAVASDAIGAGVTDYVRQEDDAQYERLAARIEEAVRQFRAENYRDDRRSQYRRLIENAPVMYVVFREEDGEPIIDDCNDRFLDRLGYERDDVIGRSIREFYAEPSADRALDGFDDGRQGAFGQRERTLIDADGNRVETLLRASPRVDDTGDVIGTFGLYVDITERTRRERTLERLHSVTRSLLRAESREDVAETITHAVRDVLGYPRNLVRLVSDDGTELRPVAITAEAERMLGDRPAYPVGEGTAGRCFAEGETLVYDDVQTVDDGYERRDAHASMFVPIGDHGVLSIGDTEVGAFDESDIHLAEIFAANADTALTLLERTTELERQNERLAEFASVISHDLRTPLTVVDGSLTLLRETYDDEELDRAARSLDRAFDLIEDLLTLARDDDALDVGPVDLRSLVESCWDTVETADATLVVASTCTFEADESRLRRVMENLLSNCVEHGAGGRSSGLTVTVGPLGDGTGFYVADDGPGIPESERDQVFEAGYTTGDEGTGLGLAIVKRIVDAHGGTVAVTESDDGGVRFEIRGVDAEATP
ncbi:MAG: ATP-binding protein [Haloplanus sp.]